MRIVFRADASQRIGTGHVTRCLTLAERLRRDGDEVLFISRTHPGNLHAAIRAAGFELLELPAPAGAGRNQAPAGRDEYADWLGTGQAEDAAECIRLLADHGAADWLVVDHYSLDREWESQLRPHAERIAVIDDLADRAHEADLLVDPLLGRDAREYRELLPAACRMLLGPDYAPLRPEFAELRGDSLAHRRGPTRGSQRLLLNLGGADPDGATVTALAGLAGAALPPDLHVGVVLGTDSAGLEAVQGAAAALPCPTEVAVGVSDLARRMRTADLAIGAAGMSAWERCCLGLPAVIITIADNQRRIAGSLEAAGAIHWLSDLDTVAGQPAAIGAAVAALLADPKRLAAMTRAAAAVTDGRGAGRVAAALHDGDEQ